MNIYGIISLIEAIIGDSEYLLGVAGTTLKSFLKGATSWVTQKSSLTIGKVIRFAQYTNKLYITNGTEQPFIVDVTKPSSNVFVGLDAPDVSSTVFTPVSSGGTIQYRGNFDASFGLFPARGMVQVLTLDSGGSSYVANDIVNVLGGAGGCQIRVLTVLSGVAQTIELYAQGLGYSVASAVGTSGGTGTGLSVNITEVVSGSGTLGAIAINDSWLINVAGTLGSLSVAVGNRIVATANTPTSSDWSKLAMEYGGRLYSFVYRDADGNVSPPSYPIYVASTGIINSVKITDIPVGALHIDLYRSAVNSPTLYLLTTLSQSDTTYTDTASDTALQTAYPLSSASVSLPITAQQILIKNDKLFFGNVGYSETGSLVDPINGSGMYVDLVTGGATGLEKSSTYKYARTYLLSDGTETPIVEPFATIATGAHAEAKAQVAIDMWFPVVASQSGIVGSKFNVIFAGAKALNGLVYSIDNGATWSINSGFASHTVRNVLNIGSKVFVTTDGGIFISTDNGLNFTPSNTGITDTDLNSIYYNGTYLYVGSMTNNMARSADLGQTWTTINLATLSTVFGFLYSSGYLYCYGIGAGSAGYILYSTDSGSTFSPISVADQVNSLAVLGSNLYAAYNAGGVYVSTDHYSTRTAFNTGLTNLNTNTLYSDGSTKLYVGTTVGGVFVSTSGGSWSNISISTLADDVDYLGIISTRLFAGSTTSIYFSDDSGVVWSESESQSLGASSIVKPDSQFTPDYSIVGSYFYPSVTGVKIYRTKANGSVYYFDRKIDVADWNTTMENGFADSIPDASLTVLYVVPTATVVNYGSRIIWSEDARLQTFFALSFLDAYADDGDVINGLVDDRNGILIYKTNSILKLYTDGSPESWVLHKLVSGTGCSDPNSLVVSKKGNFFSHNGTICKHQGESAEAPIISTLYRDTIASITSYMQATYNGLKEWVIFPVNIGDENWLVIYDTKIDSWYKFQIPFDSIGQWCALSRQLGIDADKILVAGDAGGRIGFYDTTLNTGSDVYPQANQFDVHARTKTFDFPMGVELVRPRKVWINESVKSGENIEHTLGMPETGLTVSITETGSVGIESKNIVTDSMTTIGGAKVTSLTKFYYDIKGTLLDKLMGFKFEGTILNRGRRG